MAFGLGGISNLASRPSARGLRSPGRSLKLHTFNSLANIRSRPSITSLRPTVRMGTTTTVQFDRSAMTRNWAKFNNDPLKRSGAYIRRVAVNSIRHVRSDRPSPVGKPPRSRAAARPMKRIFFDVIPRTANMVVGPMGLGSMNPVTAVQEFGRRANAGRRSIMASSRSEARALLGGRASRVPKRRRRKISMTPERRRQLLHIGEWYKNQPAGTGSGKRTDNWQPMHRFDISQGMVKYPPRPYMFPALQKSLTVIPGMWRNSISGPVGRASTGRFANIAVR